MTVTFVIPIRIVMATTGKKFTKRTQDPMIHRVLDARTKAVLNAVLTERRGQALTAYLRALSERKD